MLLRDAGLALSLLKCKLAVLSCKFLDQHIKAGVIAPQQSKIKAVTDFRRLVTKADIRSFMGLATYYKKFIPNFSASADGSIERSFTRPGKLDR